MRRAAACALGCGCALAMTRLAAADPPTAPARILVPLVQLKATSDSDGKLAASVPVVVGGEDATLHLVVPRVEVATSKGIGDITTGGEGIAWSAGATYTYVDTGVVDFELRDAAALLGRAYDLCIVDCAGAKDCKFSPEAKAKGILGANELCERGRAAFESWVNQAHPDFGVIPRSQISVGALYGRGHFEWLEGSATLTDQSDDRGRFRFGVSGTLAFAPQADFTGLGSALIVLDKRSQAASDTAHWCGPASPVENGMMGSAQVCKDVASGAPTDVTTIRFGIELGIADSRRQAWRISAEAFGKEQIDPSSKLTGGFGFPIYIDFANGPRGYGGDYKGLIVITPEITFDKDGTHGLIVFEILGQHSLFREVLD